MLGAGLRGKSELLGERPRDWFSQSFTWAGLVNPNPAVSVK